MKFIISDKVKKVLASVKMELVVSDGRLGLQGTCMLFSESSRWA